MGSIQEKMEYLQETKKKIKEAIVEKGQTVNEEDTFRSYADKIKEIEGKSELTTGEMSVLIDIASIGTASAKERIVKILNFGTEDLENLSYVFSSFNSMTEITFSDTSKVRNFANIFQSCSKLQKINNLDTSNASDLQYMFWGCQNLEQITQLDTGNATNLESLFYECSKLKQIPQLNTSKATNMRRMFGSCSTLQKIPQLNTSIATDLSSLFYGCSSLSEIPQLDTSNATDMSSLCSGCSKIKNIPELDVSSVKDIYRIFDGCRSLLTFGGLKNLGKAYTEQKASHSDYTLDLSQCTLLTHDSLVNTINGLYDLNLTYSTVGEGTLYKQNLKLGATNKAKLSEAEIAIATNKGWDIT